MLEQKSNYESSVRVLRVSDDSSSSSSSLSSRSNEGARAKARCSLARRLKQGLAEVLLQLGLREILATAGKADLATRPMAMWELADVEALGGVVAQHLFFQNSGIRIHFGAEMSSLLYFFFPLSFFCPHLFDEFDEPRMDDRPCD